MNEGEALVLGRRAKQCAQWRWTRGMRTFTGYRMVTNTGYRVSDEDAQTDAPIPFDDDSPDLRDPATLGCLVALVRDAWPTAPAVTARHERYVRTSARGQIKMEHQWTCSYCTGADWSQAHGETEAEALVAALEAAGTQERGEEDGA